MPRYYFDTRDDDDFVEDEFGIDYPDLEAVAAEAARSLAELARDVLPGSLKRVLMAEVRDGRGPVLRARMTFEARILRAE
ncbi:MAG TPA: hypothetical protein VF702_12635 [Allosphingosinicella sp.]|jgi:hypothetical protein